MCVRECVSKSVCESVCACVHMRALERACKSVRERLCVTVRE